MEGDRDLVLQLAAAADRLDELADVADLMGDEAGAARFRREGSIARRRALAILDAATPGEPG